MFYLLRCVSRTKPCVFRRDYHHNNRQHVNRGKPEKSNLIKVTVVGSGSFGDPACLTVRTCDNFLNVFNCGEGTFRMMYSKGHRFRYLSNIFCTSNRWQHVGGVPSLARAVFDRTNIFPTFHGPPQIESLLPKFAQLTDICPDTAVSSRTFNTEPFYEDSFIQVDFVNLHRENAPTSEVPSVVAYVCRLQPRKGTLMLNKFTEHGLPIEHMKAFTNGRDVTLEDGTVLLAKDFTSPGFTGGNFLVIDVPSSEYLADLENNQLLNDHISEIQSHIGMEFVAHFAPSEIINTPQYQQFMRRTKAKRHLALNDINKFSGLKHVHLMQNTLHTLDPEIYPLLQSQYVKSNEIYSNLDEVDITDSACIEPVLSGTKYFFPLNGRLNLKEEAQEEDETDSTTDVESDQETEEHASTDRASIFPKVVVFGTGSSFPGVTKTTTSILVHTTSNSSILLDCGEGSVGQICRFYGSQTEDVIRSIKALHITHMHGDHHMGVMNLIRIRQKMMPENRPRLLLLAPKKPFDALLDFYEENFGNVRDELTMIDNEDLINPSEITNELTRILNVSNLRTCQVPHLDPSYAISLETSVLPERQEQFKLTFSGDTIPCDSLVDLGKDSTLLIHEATLEDTLAASAATKMHSTISQAIEQGERMNSKYTLLTHFSQRYRVLPPINDELIENKNVGLALDNMEITPCDLSRLNKLYFKLKETYADDLKMAEKRSERYARRNERNDLSNLM